MTGRPRDRVEPQGEWRRDARCRDVPNPSIFFDEKDPQPAIAICEVCTVRDECLSWALSNGVVDGVWGGQDLGFTTREMERAARAKRAKSQHRKLRAVLPQDPPCPECEDNLGVFKIDTHTYRCIGCGNLWKVA